MDPYYDQAPAAPAQFTPGTEILFDNQSHSTPHLQTTVKGDSRIVLIPQPSLNDLNDPLRWPLWKKYSTFCNAIYYSFIGALTGPIMAAGFIPLSQQFDTSLQRLSYASGSTLAMQGVATIFWMPFAVKFGRRPIYLLSNILMGIACIWLALASTRTYPLFLLGRIFLGIFEAPFEAITPSTITDIFFLHDRGKYVSLYGLAVLSGSALGPLISAFIIQWRGMRWAFYIVAMFIGLSVVIMFLGMPETKYTGQRPSSLSLEDAIHSNHSALTAEDVKDVEVSSDATEELVPPRPYVRSLALWTKADPSASLLQTLLQPFYLVIYPTVLWSSVVYGLALSWNIILSVTVAQLFAPPPYNFDSSTQGLIFISPFIGSVVGTYLSGPFADAVANYFTKRNNGIREPEMRLPTCALAAVTTTVGVIIAAVTYNAKTHWAGPVVGYGVLSAGAQMGATLAMSYSLDCHKELSAELMVTVTALKSLIAWMWTWFINDWIEKDGMLVVFLVIGAINLIVYMTTILLFFRGKAVRSWIHRTFAKTQAASKGDSGFTRDS